ncbi:DNA polymerase III subunit delta [Daejeonella oryzae]|uniref:DNA polymerase III subunit delta n=1 Tax=Daejeonella oryzae TaxID=1122943 RepID=UPI000418B93E|nr:DNA polymerase III subunit delta [Daejeonella oryzae]
MNIHDLVKDLKSRKFKPVYLLHGEESYYIDKISDYIEDNVLSDAEKGFNQTILYGKDTDIMTILNSAKRFPMMSEFQVVLVKEAQELKWGKDSEDDKKAVDPLLNYLEHPLQSTILVFCYKHGKFDKRKKTYKAIDKKGLVFESAQVYENKIASWIEDFVREKNYRINARAAALMAEYLGNDLSKIANELEKLMLNCVPGTEINAEDVQDNIGISKEYNVFELQNALVRRDVFKVNQIIQYFASNPKANPMPLVLGALNTYFSKVLKFHYAKDRSQQGLAKELGVSPYFVKDYEIAGRNFDKIKTFQVISYLRDCDLRSKGVDATGNTSDGELLKELVFKIIH